MGIQELSWFLPSLLQVSAPHLSLQSRLHPASRESPTCRADPASEPLGAGDVLPDSSSSDNPSGQPVLSMGCVANAELPHPGIVHNARAVAQSKILPAHV